MHNGLTASSPGRRANFEEHGWLVLPGVVPATKLEELNRLFDDLMTPFAAPGAGERSVVQRPNACRTHPVMLRHLYDGVAAIACDLLSARSIQLLQDVLLLKHPSPAGSIALHQDYSYTGYLEPPSGLSVGLALTDATSDSGCLYVVDTSHRWGLIGGFRVFANTLQTDLDTHFSATQRALVERATIPLEVRAGDVTIHHSLTLHGSDNNTSGRPRKSIIAHLVSGDCRLVPERVPREALCQFATDGQRHLAGPAFPTLFHVTDRPADAAQGGNLA